MPLLSVVVPVYQNEEDLPELVRRLREACERLEGFEAELLFVDDGSGDGSFGVLAAEAGRDPAVRVLRLSRNFGSNPAILAGLSHAHGDAVVVIAADLQDPPELIPEMVGRWKAGAQVVLAARKTREDPLMTRTFAAVFNQLFRRLVFPEFPRGGFDFVLLDRQVASLINTMPEKHSYLFGQIMWAGFQRSVVHYTRERRRSGRSGWSFGKKVKYFIDAFTAFTFLPLRLAAITGFLLAVGGFAYAGLVVVMRFRGEIPERGFAALMVVLLVTSGAQLIVSGVIGEYLWRVLEEVRPRPAFVVAATLNVHRQPSSTRPVDHAEGQGSKTSPAPRR